MVAALVDIDELTKAIDHLEPLPQSTTRLASLLLDDDSDLDEIVRVSSLDQALTASLLRMANSAASAGRRNIVNPKDAVMRLGRGTILSLVMASGVQSRMVAAIPQYGLSERALWSHSVAAAVAAEVIPKFCEVPVPPEAYASALLHDIGKLVMCRFLSPEIMEFLRQAYEEGGLSPFDAEREVLQVHHAELGGLVARHWGLPDGIVNGINYHHDPSEGGERIGYVVYLANVTAHVVESDPDEEVSLPSDFEETIGELGVSLERFEKLCATTEEKFQQVQSVYG